jgi:hypothetical protein
MKLHKDPVKLKKLLNFRKISKFVHSVKVKMLIKLKKRNHSLIVTNNIILVIDFCAFISNILLMFIMYTLV